uniref:Pre-mRNA-processing factor 17 n=1 Tax=Globodera pallida TaxID=36090 RepID=A0A183BLG6_GLOPA
MDLLKSYSGGSSSSDSEEESADVLAVGPSSSAHDKLTMLSIPPVNLTPSVIEQRTIQQVAVVDPKTKELYHNPRFEELFQPESGPHNPFKSVHQRAPKNTLAGFVEPAHFNAFHFDRSLRSYDTLGYADNPTAEASAKFVGDVGQAKEKGGESLFEALKTGGQKRKRVINYDASNVDGYTGPWARFDDEKTVARPDAELQKEMDEIVRKRKLKSRAGRRAAIAELHLAEESTKLHIKDDTDYLGRSFMEPPKYTGTNLREDFVPDRCYPPTKQAHTYSSHTKPVTAIRWFPRSAHMFISSSMDGKVKLWEVYGNRKLIRTYTGHKVPVKDIYLNNTGTELLSAAYDNYIKLWDTETGQVKTRFTIGGHRAYVIKFNPDDDKQNIFMAGMSNKKIIQWDTRTGEVEQEYDRHLGPVNSITFFDKNRRFVSTSDDKSLRIWEFGIPVDTKLIQHAGLHSIPSMTRAPNEKWIVGQSMDNRIVLFQIVDDKLRFARKKAFRGHNTAGYACSTDFSPEMNFLASGDADGKITIWDWRTHKIVSTWKAHDNVCISTLWHPHEKSRMISCGWDNVIKMWV